jgi:hypothetical protein
MRVDGSCHCGRIAFSAEVDPAAVGVCHCADCQKLTGSAFRANVPAPAATFRILRGEPRLYVKTADSGARRAHAFCPDCGTPIYATAAEGERTSYSLRIGTLNQRHALGPPRRQIWTASALPWAKSLLGVQAHARQ